MPYITSVERLGILRTRQEDVIDVLNARFGELSSELIERINDLDDLPVLKQLYRQAIVIGSLEEFQQLLVQS